MIQQHRLLHPAEKLTETDEWYDWFTNEWYHPREEMIGSVGTSRPPCRRKIINGVDVDGNEEAKDSQPRNVD
jgi:hypothetical protein